MFIARMQFALMRTESPTQVSIKLYRFECQAT